MENINFIIYIFILKYPVVFNNPCAVCERPNYNYSDHICNYPGDSAHLRKHSGLNGSLEQSNNVLISVDWLIARENCVKTCEIVYDDNCVTRHVVTSYETKESRRGLENRWRPSWWRELSTVEGEVSPRGQSNTAEQRSDNEQGDQEGQRNKARRMSSKEQREPVEARSWTLDRKQPYSLEVKRIGDRNKR
jgi:hypothetical protein